MPVDPSCSRFCNSARITFGARLTAAAARRARSSRSFCLSANATSTLTSLADRKSETFMIATMKNYELKVVAAPDLIGRAQAIADTGLGENELRPFGICLDLLAELAHIYPQVLGVGQIIP